MILSVGTRMGSTPLQYTSPSAGRGEWKEGRYSMSGTLVPHTWTCWFLIVGKQVLKAHHWIIVTQCILEKWQYWFCKHILGDVTWQDDCGFGIVFSSLFLAIDNNEDKKMFYALLGSAKWVKLNVLIIMFCLFWWALILVLFILILVVLNTHLFKHTRS